jgi:dihydrofolate reductase
MFKSFDDAIQTLTTKYSNQIETIYAIGGSSIYRQALEYPVGFLDKIYLTRVFSSESDTKCDVFLEPANFLDNFKKLENNLQDNIFEAEFNRMHKEPANNLEYVFEVYERI